MSADDFGGSGVKTIHYTIDGGAEATCDSGYELQFATEGVYKVEYWAEDIAGNLEAGTNVEWVKLDKTAPTITITAPADGAAYTFNQVVPSTWAVTDAGSGPDTGSFMFTKDNGVAFDTSTVGPKTFKVTAYDVAGNYSEKTVRYSVRYKWLGILPPVNDFPLNPAFTVMSAFKLGSTIPVKFRIADVSGSPVTNAVATISVVKLNGTVPDTVEAEIYSTSAATSGYDFRYSATDDLYIFNLGTKTDGKRKTNLGVGTFQINITLGDGSSTTSGCPQLADAGCAGASTEVDAGWGGAARAAPPHFCG